MKTSGSCRLGNFLSGMETGLDRSRLALVGVLGNFLSGMETHITVVVVVDAMLPWKLP